MAKRDNVTFLLYLFGNDLIVERDLVNLFKDKSPIWYVVLGLGDHGSWGAIKLPILGFIEG